MKRLFVAIGACGLMVGLAFASGGTDVPVQPNQPKAPATIPVLIEQLGAEDFAQRESAAASLEKMGPAAMEALQTATRHANPEIRERVGLILARLKRSIDSGKSLAAKRVKLDYKDVPLGSAINDLKNRTGLNFVLDSTRVANPLRRITCQTGELPTWEALEAFCTATGLRETFRAELEVPKPTGPRRGYVPAPQAPLAEAVPIVLVDGKAERLPGDRSTAVRIVALPSSFPGHKVTLGTGETTLCLDVTPAPGLNWQEVTGVKISRVIDSAGRLGGAGTDKTEQVHHDPNAMMMFVRPGVAMRIDASGNPMLPEAMPNPRVLAVPLRLGTSTASSLKRLEGVVYGEIKTLNQHLITIDLKRNVGVPVSGPSELRCTVLEMKEPAGPGGLGSVKVQLEYPSPWVARARRRGPMFNPGWPEMPNHPSQGYRVEAFDAAGKPLPVNSNAFTDMSDDGLISLQTLQFTFRPGAGTPAKVVVVGPKSINVEIPFVLENVPLP